MQQQPDNDFCNNLTAQQLDAAAAIKANLMNEELGEYDTFTNNLNNLNNNKVNNGDIMEEVSLLHNLLHHIFGESFFNLPFLLLAGWRRDAIATKRCPLER